MNETIEKIKNHIRENRKVYIAGAVCFTVGIVVGVLAVKRPSINSYTNMTRILSPGDNNILKVYISALGDPGNVVQCVETGTIYASQGQAARELGVTAAEVSKHLKGHYESLKGLHLVLLGKAGQVLA